MTVLVVRTVITYFFIALIRQTIDCYLLLIRELGALLVKKYPWNVGVRGFLHKCESTGF